MAETLAAPCAARQPDRAQRERQTKKSKLYGDARKGYYATHMIKDTIIYEIAAGKGDG